MTMWSETTEGMHNLFRLSSRSSLEGFFYKPRADRELLHQLRQGPDRDDRLPLGRDPDPAAPGAVRRGPPLGRRVPGDLRQGQLLPGADGPRDRHREAGPRRPAAARQGARHPAGRHQRLALQQPRGRRRPRRPDLRRFGQAALRHQPAQVRRRRLLHQVRGRDARAVGRPVRDARGLRQHAAHRRALRGRVHRVHRRLHGARRRAGRRDRGVLVRQGGLARDRVALPRRAADPRGQGSGSRWSSAIISQKGYCGYYLVVADFINWAKDNGIRVGPGPWLRRRVDRGLRAADHRPVPARARPVLRALPQPRAPVDARLRHRLRRPPSRRGDPVRHRQVRRATGSPRSRPSAGSSPRRRSRTPPGCSTTASRSATGSPRRSRPT